MLTKVLPNEKELVLRLSQGNEQAFERIYNFYSARLYGHLLKLVKSESVASEILQHVFIKIWEIRADLDPEKSFRSYLFRIAENKVYDFFRKAASDKKLRQRLLREATEEYCHIEEDIAVRENAAMLHQAMDSLSPQRNHIFRLCKIDGKTYRQVSDILGISESTISDHIVKANRYIYNYLSVRLSLFYK